MILMIIDLIPFINLGLGGAALGLIGYLLLKARKDSYIERTKFIDEINKRDERYIELLKDYYKTLEANTTVLEIVANNLKDKSNEK